ncbi:MAG: hypothetical protein AAGA30_13905, partial [Planctomycetota bacterium]
FDPAKTHGIAKFKGHTFGILDQVKSGASTGVGFASSEALQLRDGTQKSVQWAVGRNCQIKVRIAGDQPMSVVATVWNPVQLQNISVRCNGDSLSTLSIPNQHDFLTPIEICLVNNLDPGDYLLDLEFSDAVKEQGGERDLAMLFSDIELGEAIRSEMSTQIAAA